MDTVNFTLGERWREQFSAGMDVVRVLAHYELPVLETNFSVDFALDVLNKLASGTLRPSRKSAERGLEPHRLLQDRPPQLEASAKYLLVTLNAMTSRAEFVSSATGGIAFEDPFWAILSAAALSQKKMTVLPKATSNEELWKNVSVVHKTVQEGSYNPLDFFDYAQRFVPPAESPRFKIATVTSDQLEGLRSRGMQTLRTSTPPEFYELFGPGRR
jgi:hypothetical protein